MSGERTFPVLANESELRAWPGCPRSVPWSFIEPGRHQAAANPGQTLERLAERGGLCPGEMRCALEGRKLWPHFNNLGEDGNKARSLADAEWLSKRLCALAQQPCSIAELEQPERQAIGSRQDMASEGATRPTLSDLGVVLLVGVATAWHSGAELNLIRGLEQASRVGTTDRSGLGVIIAHPLNPFWRFCSCEGSCVG